MAPVTSTDWNRFDLLGINQAAHFGRTAIEGLDCSGYLDGAGNVSYFQPDINCSRLTDRQFHARDLNSAESLLGYGNLITANRQRRKIVDTDCVSHGLTMQTIGRR